MQCRISQLVYKIATRFQRLPLHFRGQTSVDIVRRQRNRKSKMAVINRKNICNVGYLNEIPTATPIFSEFCNTVGLVLSLSDVGVTDKSIMVAIIGSTWLLAYFPHTFMTYLSFIAYYIPTLDVVQYSHQSCCVARLRSCCRAR